MSVTLQQPKFLVDAAKQYGVKLDPVVQYDAARPLAAVSAQFNGEEADFGCCFGEFGREQYPNMPMFSGDAQFGSFLRHIIGRKADRALGKGLKAVGKVGAIATFAIPGVGPLVGGGLTAALAAGDKVLGGTPPKQRAKIIANTKAAAALGDPHAKRGALVLATVDQIRKQNNVPPGKAAIKIQGKINPQAFTKVIPKHQVKRLAAKTAATKPTFWEKVKRFLHIGTKAKAAAQLQLKIAA